MGPVDSNDQMTTVCKSRKQLRWYMRLIIKYLAIPAYNSYIIDGHFKEHAPENHGRRDFTAFREDLIHELVGNWRTQKARRGRDRKLHFNWKMWVNTFQQKEREVITPAKSVGRNVADSWQFTLMFRMRNWPINYQKQHLNVKPVMFICVSQENATAFTHGTHRWNTGGKVLPQTEHH